MINFLDSTGLSRLVENIKNKFQPKPFLLELSVSYDRQTHEGSVSIREDDIARAFDHLYKYKDSSDYNISFKVYHSDYDCTYICKANSITFQEAYFNINIDCSLHLADDKDQLIGHIRLSIDAEIVEGYYDEQNIIYDNSVLLTGTGCAVRPERYYINFEENFFQKYSDIGGLLSDEYYFDVKENMKILYKVFKSFYDGNPITFNINEENISGTINNIIPIVNISEDNYIQASFIIIDPNTDGVDTDGLYIRKIAFDINSDGSYSLYKMKPIQDLSLTNIKESTLFVEQYLTDKGYGNKFLANDGKYKEVKGYDKVYYGSYDYFATDGGGASQKIRDEAKELLLAGKNVIIYDDRVGALYNVGYIDDDEFIFKISGYNPQLGYILIDIVDFGDIYANNIIKIFSEKGYGNKFLADDGSYVHTSKLITFKAENGSLDAKQKEDIDEGYNRNLPMYVLYSGIKMLVNSIQKLGDVWSLSCRHEGVVYSVTIDTAEMSYNVIANV